MDIPTSSPIDSPAIVLISCYELGQQPLGLVVPAGVLRREGFHVLLNDIAIETLDEDAIATACIVGISVPMHTALRLGVQVALRVRVINPGTHICFYGLYAELNAEYLLSHVADSCLGGEFAADLLELARIHLGDKPVDSARNVGLYPGDPSAAARRGGDLGFAPDRAGLAGVAHYVRLDDGAADLRNVGTTSTTRGCKHTCLHCPVTPVYNGRFFANPVDEVLADITALVESGVSHITFADPDFLNGPGHARRVACRMHGRFPGITFVYTARIDHLGRQRELVEELQGYGNLFVVTALESVNDRALAALDKGHTRDDALGVIRHFHEIGLTLRPTLLPFTPWETLDSYIELLDIVASEGLIENIDPVQYSMRLLVPPGSALLGSAELTPHLGELDAPNFSYAWTHPDTRMDRLQSDVTAIAEQQADDPQAAFDAIRNAAHIARGDTLRASHVTAPQDGRQARPPRLTEAWFC